MSDSEDDEAEAAEFMSQPEINEFLEEAEEEKEQLAGRSGRHWKPMVFEEVFEVAETTHFPSGFQPRTRTIPQERFASPAAVFDTVYGDIWPELVVASNLILAAKYPNRKSFTEIEIRKYTGMKFFERRYRAQDTCKEFWARVKKHPMAFDASDLDFLSYHRYAEINKCLDIGKNQYVRHASSE